MIVYLWVMSLALMAGFVWIVILRTQSISYDYHTDTVHFQGFTNEYIDDLLWLSLPLLLLFLGLYRQKRWLARPPKSTKAWLIFHLAAGIPIALVTAFIVNFILALGHLDCGNSCAPGTITTNQSRLIDPIIYLFTLAYVIVPSLYRFVIWRTNIASPPNVRTNK